MGPWIYMKHCVKNKQLHLNIANKSCRRKGDNMDTDNNVPSRISRMPVCNSEANCRLQEAWVRDQQRAATAAAPESVSAAPESVPAENVQPRDLTADKSRLDEIIRGSRPHPGKM
jgi:hypothetical protein